MSTAIVKRQKHGVRCYISQANKNHGLLPKVRHFCSDCSSEAGSFMSAACAIYAYFYFSVSFDFSLFFLIRYFYRRVIGLTADQTCCEVPSLFDV